MEKDKNKISNLIINKNGIKLLEHSKLVSIFAEQIAIQTLPNNDKSLIDSIKTAALLMNIGKCCKVFQKDIKKPSKKDLKVKYLYNEVGWAFITKYISSKSNLILDVVYWSNGIKIKTLGDYNNNILDSVDAEDKATMLEFLKDVLPQNYNYYPNDTKCDAPIYYSGDTTTSVITNSEKTFVRTCIISAEMLVSSLDINKFKELYHNNNIDEVVRLIDNLTKRNFYNIKSELDFTKYDEKRLHIQKSINEQCTNTTIVNAPAGFGKSLLAILWNFNSNRKMIVVCPTNVIAESTYKNILTELNTLGVGDKVSMELYLTSEIKKTNGVNRENAIEFDSDIIVTNIDNFLAPSINSNNASRLFLINKCDVVFDEYHKLLCKEALFACFINIMNTRNRFTDSRTLLMSATPIKINQLWDNGLNKTKILPSENSHYPASHKGKYKINTFIVETIDDIKVKSKSSSAVIFNSIENSQILHNKINSAKLAHSKFGAIEKESIYSYIYKNFDKNSSRSLNKANITSTHVIQESLDISFANIHESVLSPNASWQRMGRCNRFGDYDTIPEINTYKILKGGGENKMKDILYTKDLSDKWFDFLSNYNGKVYDLDKWYTKYNEFNRINSKDIDKYSELCFHKGMVHLSGIFPIKYTKSKAEKKIKAGANKLRSIGKEIFFICKIDGSNKYSDIFTDINYTDFKGYNEDKTTQTRMVKAMKEIMKSGDDRFDYTSLIKKSDKSIMQKEANNSDTPYIRFDVVYTPEYGIIKNETLSEINKNKK